MASRKMIELTFSDENTMIVNEAVKEDQKKDDDSFETVNIGGLLFGIKKPRAKDEQPQNPDISPSNEVKEIKNILPKPSAQLQQFPVVDPKHHAVIPKSTKPVVTHKPKAESQIKKPQEQKAQVEAPKVTEADWKIFKMFMDPLPKPSYTEEASTSGCTGLIKNKEEFVCSICERFMSRRQGVKLETCSHNFCRECLIDEINHKHDAMGQVRCPLVVEKCEAFIKDEEVKALLGVNFPQFALKIMQSLDKALGAKQLKDDMAALKKADDLDFIENAEEFECKICYVDIEVGAGITLKNCRHQFCKECFVDSVKHSEDVLVKCPFMGDDGKSCDLAIQEREIRALVPRELFDKYLDKSLNKFQATNINTYHCKTPDCKGFIEFDRKVLGFKCFVCEKVNCITCKVIHQGKNCQEYEDQINPNGKRIRENAESENTIKQLVKNGEAMFCPMCQIPVMKSIGCDFITCTTCKLGICWVTKKPRKPLTRADGTFIDGCHCREGGDRNLCHPKCNFCH